MLAGRTVFITGASRGIGKAIALRVARDGANVVIAAKTADPHPKLPGTIFTAAKEVEEAGGKCLPCVVDVRFEDQIEKAVGEAAKQFGGIDILINNASAISLTGTDVTPMKTYDLMMGINTRGTYLCSKVCLPYLKKGKNPHILNISPPLNMNQVWFKDHVAYTMAKYGMSMCVLGMSEEFKSYGIAVNALWPRTAIYTAAMKMLGGGDDVAKQCRKPEIMADAAYQILTKDSKSYSGHFAIDDEVLTESGVTDLGQYDCVPGNVLLPDFFLDVDPKQLQDQLDDGKPSASGPQKIFQAIEKMLDEEMVKSVGGVFQFNLQGADAGTWYLDMKNGAGAVGQGEPEAADVTMTMDSGDFVKMFEGNLKPTAAFMTGKVKISGNLGFAMKLEKLMVQMQKSQKSGEAAEAAQQAPAAGTGGPQKLFQTLEKMLNEELVKSVNGVFQFNLQGADAGTWYLDMKNGAGAVGQGEPEAADVTMTMDSGDFVKMFEGSMKPTAAFMTGKLKLSGNMALAMKLEKLMGQMPKSKL
ncbi:hydroxysteroid dehydrogenase-like protein 2 [Lingula anatina]|uniref:Hydroxysteroid dehydrogenase-like protein 2 n=1 Tax=Lingula anatina TaxID=7574 RepID=A0A1S3IEQ7_LINAN|nr:hydroxysteroid dehydrogenase-like protein 2 [Lingula anatina]XP_013396627.1 hydroxysteroid dehydrogenase-like protein 2 [Lingula anatina]XP_013396628.1 hydroxysteroid dehydrogenase-like protein 2 [Lingula anatina]|eukprot:XP_013396626.1 hydroxysteroid dehydrogenase-like protein 2 [Lingula anatina]